MDELRNLREINLRQEQLLKEILLSLNRLHEHQRLAAGKKDSAPAEWLDKQEVLALLHISERTLFNLRKGGFIREHQLGGKIYYSASQIKEYLENSKPQTD